jgi:hypothetical protein
MTQTARLGALTAVAPSIGDALLSASRQSEFWATPTHAQQVASLSTGLRYSRRA